MPAIARKLQVVRSYADALRYQHLNTRILESIVRDDEQLIRDAASTVGVSEDAAASAVGSVNRRLQAAGLQGAIPGPDLRTQILEAIVRNSRFHDITDQTWTKLVKYEGRLAP